MAGFLSSSLSAFVDRTLGFEDAPPPAFSFRVSFGNWALKDETAFQEVSGINTEVETEEVVEGGENRYVQRLPKGVKHSPLELKRGVGALNSPLVTWCRQIMEGEFTGQIMTTPLTVYLMDINGMPLRGWLFADAFPIKWDIEAFNSTKNEVAIEKIVLTYTYSESIV